MFYVDLGTDTDADAQVSGGIGTELDPFNARAFVDRATLAGPGLATDEYLLKGYCFTAVSSRLSYRKLSAWDLVTFGPWQINPTGIFSSTPQDSLAVMRDGVLENLNGTFPARSGTFNNMNFPLGTRLSNHNTFWNGCTIAVKVENASNNRAITAVNCVFEDFAQSGVGNLTINATNCTFSQSKATIEALNGGGWTVNDTNCQFGVTYNEVFPRYGDTDPNLFSPDSAITIPGSGTYDEHLTGLFGQARISYELATGKGPLGGSYFISAPVFENSTPFLNNPTNDGADVQIQTNQDTDAYLVVVPYLSGQPTKAQIKLGQDSSGSPALFSGSTSLTASVQGSITITGQTDNLFDVYVIAENVAPIISDIEYLLFDNQIPIWNSGFPNITNNVFTDFDVNLETNENGNGYLVVVPKDSTPPTDVEVKAGQASGGGAPIFSGNVSLTADTTSTINVTGLVSAEYDVYCIAEDTVPNCQFTPIKVISRFPVIGSGGNRTGIKLNLTIGL